MERREQERLITELIRALGTSLKNRGIYPASHPLVRTPVEIVYRNLSFFFVDRSELALAISDGTLVLEGVPIFTLTSSLEYFMETLGRIGVPAIIFQKNLTINEIENFIRFLHETKEQGLSPDRIQDLLSQAGIVHIRVKPVEKDSDFSAAREIYDSAVSVVVSVLREVRVGKIPSGAETERVVRDMSSMLVRNRDAMLALTLIKNYDEYTYTHSVNVSVLALALADAFSLPDRDKVDVGMAGLLHDVGKTQLALDLIRKPGTLTNEEFEEIKKHPEQGFALLGKMSHIRPDSAYMVREHHLRFDRKGYPNLEPEYITHPHSNLIPVADCYDALTTLRSYQRAHSPQEALKIMTKISGTSLDGEIVKLMAKTMGNYPVGTMVRLNTMEVGLVSGAGLPGEDPQRVIVMFDRDGMPLPSPEEVDLTDVERSTGKPRWTIVCTVNPNLFPPLPVESILESIAKAS